MKPWDAYLAILQLDKDDVKQLKAERSIRPILKNCIQTRRIPSRTDRESILSFAVNMYLMSGAEMARSPDLYTYWARKALTKGNYEAIPGDDDRCIVEMNRYLIDCGYPSFM